MAFKFLEKILPVRVIESSAEYDTYSTEKLGTLKVPESLTDNNAFVLANTVPEIYFPIDFIADRLSKLRFYIAKASTDKEQKNTELNRFITDINPFYSFNDLIYQYVFSLFADGSAYKYLAIPDIYSANKPTVNNISRLDILQPNLISISEYTNLSLLNVSNYNDLIKKAEYNDNTRKNELNLDRLSIDTYGIRKRSDSVFLTKSPMFAANKPIDTLLSVYSARYNVYANNGSAGYLARKTSPAGNNTLDSIALDNNKRDEILNDLKSRNGLTGRKNLWGISGIPIEFVNTLATIKDLMPLDETLETSIKIAGVFQIPAGLVPRKDQSTYSNQDADERKVWENTLLSMLELVCYNFSRTLGLKDVGYKIGADISNVAALVQNESSNQDLLAKRLANIEKMKQLKPDLDVNLLIENILNDGKGQ